MIFVNNDQFSQFDFSSPLVHINSYLDLHSCEAFERALGNTGCPNLNGCACEECVLRCCQLNGNNGSWTNSDDHNFLVKNRKHKRYLDRIQRREAVWVEPLFAAYRPSGNILSWGIQTIPLVPEVVKTEVEVGPEKNEEKEEVVVEVGDRTGVYSDLERSVAMLLALWIISDFESKQIYMVAEEQLLMISDRPFWQSDEYKCDCRRPWKQWERNCADYSANLNPIPWRLVERIATPNTPPQVFIDPEFPEVYPLEGNIVVEGECSIDCGVEEVMVGINNTHYLIAPCQVFPDTLCVPFCYPWFRRSREEPAAIEHGFFSQSSRSTFGWAKEDFSFAVRAGFTHTQILSVYNDLAGRLIRLFCDAPVTRDVQNRISKKGEELFVEMYQEAPRDELLYNNTLLYVTYRVNVAVARRHILSGVPVSTSSLPWY